MDGIKKVWPKWEPVEVIGRGGFGTVYKAKRENFGEVSYSAIKVVKIPNDDAEIKEMTTSGLSKEHIKDYYKKTVISLVDEIKLMEKMKSASHIVGIEDYEVVENENGVGWIVYIRMELLKNIQDYFMNKQVTNQEVIKLGTDILTALEFCHAQNVIHRDIKPGNIFVSEFGEFKLGDFGISREVEKTNATMSQKGTKSYMAPEMVRMEKYGKNVDLYALGLTMYELLNHGRMPFLPPFPQPFFPQDREDAMLKRLSGEVFPEIEGAGHLNAVIQKACHANSNMRYQSAKEMKDALLNQTINEEKTQFGGFDINEKTQVGGFDFFGSEETQNMFQNNEQTFVNKDEKTMSVFSNGFMFEDVKTTNTFEDKKIFKEEPKKQNLQPLTTSCPHCGKTAYLVAPNVYLCNDCWKMVRLNNDASTIELNNLYVALSNNEKNPKVQLEYALKMLAIAPTHGQVNNRVGLYYGKLGDNEKRKYYYEQAFKYDDRDALILNNLAVVAIDEKRYWDALEFLKRANEAIKKGQCSAANQKNTILSNQAVCYENVGMSKTAFSNLTMLYHNNYQDCTYLASQFGIGKGLAKSVINDFLTNKKKFLPTCVVSDQASLQKAKTTYNVASNDEVLMVFFPKLMFGGSKQGIAFTTRAIYFFVNGEATFISYYRLGNVDWHADWQGHIQFGYRKDKSKYDVQFARDSKQVVEFMHEFTRALGIITIEDIMTGLGNKK